MGNVKTIKNLFNKCLNDAILLSDKINELEVKEYHSDYMLSNNLKCYQSVFEIYDSTIVEGKSVHCGSFNLEITTQTIDGDECIHKIVMYTQVYGISYILEFEDFEQALYDMLVRRYKFEKQ